MNNKTQAFELLQSIIEEAINMGADIVELEYAYEGMEVTYLVGIRGIGSLLKDRTLESSIIDLIIELAKLQNKSSGVMKFVIGDKVHRIKVEEYESFGETSFRLYLPRRI